MLDSPEMTGEYKGPYNRPISKLKYQTVQIAKFGKKISW
jgi:hypothetical protein